MKEIRQIISPLGIILLAVILRLVPHIPNVAPIAAMALFGGAYLNKKYALIVPILAMVVSDIFLGFSWSTPMVYVSFLITGLIGLWLRKHKNVQNVILATLSSSLIFFILTNFNFWYVTSMYPKTFSGMVEAYVMALPFFRNTILGDLFYTGVFFGGFEFILKMTKSKNISLHQV